MFEWFISNEDKTEERNEDSYIFMFPYAGGSASVFKKWQVYFKGFEVFAAQYPGRENRINEKPIDKFDEILSNLYDSISKFIFTGSRYYLFGHSLGTKIVYELVLKIKENKLRMPEGIIVSAGKAPCFKEENPIYYLEDDEFIKGINRFSGTPSEIIENNDIMKIFLPMLRADFILDETYVNPNITKIDVPILGLMGTEDKELTIEELLKWKEYTSQDFSYKYIEGGHMFINTNTEKVASEIKKFIYKCNDKSI